MNLHEQDISKKLRLANPDVGEEWILSKSSELSPQANPIRKAACRELRDQRGLPTPALPCNFLLFESFDLGA